MVGNAPNSRNDAILLRLEDRIGMVSRVEPASGERVVDFHGPVSRVASGQSERRFDLLGFVLPLARPFVVQHDLSGRSCLHSTVNLKACWIGVS